MSFNDIIGQDAAIRFLRSAVRNNRLSHAYIFAGPKGCGRSLLARTFAKVLNCEDMENAPCDMCSSCSKIDRDLHPDVIWIRKDEKSGQIKIDQIRQLASQIAFRPYEGKYKVSIIVEAELMNIEAANSFLKTLEEPPPNSLLILIVERPKDLLPTIVSRCQLIRLRPLGDGEMKSVLIDKYGLSGERAEYLAKFSEGRLGRVKGVEENIFEKRDSVLKEFSGDECVEDYTAGNRNELSEKLGLLAAWYRDLIAFKATNDSGLLINRDKIDDIRGRSSSFEMNRLIQMFESVLDTKEKIESNVNPKLALSAMFRIIGDE